jgi:hypothetical protein
LFLIVFLFIFYAASTEDNLITGLEFEDQQVPEEGKVHKHLRYIPAFSFSFAFFYLFPRLAIFA